ncbi:hypothetical protein CIB48_g1394 [Xylaria polymorpha]|nr:hypothetical protein CIB48_g1394 [Xylaria polymorpha]
MLAATRLDQSDQSFRSDQTDPDLLKQFAKVGNSRRNYSDIKPKGCFGYKIQVETRTLRYHATVVKPLTLEIEAFGYRNPVIAHVISYLLYKQPFLCPISRHFGAGDRQTTERRQWCLFFRHLIRREPRAGSGSWRSSSPTCICLRPSAQALNGSDLDSYGGHLKNLPHLINPGGEANVWYIDTPPGGDSPMHRTISLDFVVLVEGEVQLTLDSGEVRDLKPGDIIIQRGTMHK